MELDLLFVLNSVLLGIGLAMDAFSVSLANGLNETGMKKKKMCMIAGIFAFFQAAMPMLGWVGVNVALRCFEAIERFIPLIALALLLFIGIGMIRNGIGSKDNEEGDHKVGLVSLLVQGVATSIDALSVGFTIAGYDLEMALIRVLIIAAVTFVICMAGIVIGKRFGTGLSGRAAVLGGMILIFIGIEIFVTGVFR